MIFQNKGTVPFVVKMPSTESFALRSGRTSPTAVLHLGLFSTALLSKGIIQTNEELFH